MEKGFKSGYGDLGKRTGNMKVRAEKKKEKKNKKKIIHKIDVR